MKTNTEIFFDALTKAAAFRSERFSELNPINAFGPGFIGGLIGASSRPYSDEEQRRINKKSHSNFWIPGVGAYRANRRINSIGMRKDERKKHSS